MGNESTLNTGTPLSQARAAMLLLHGRGADAASIVALTDWLDTPGFALLAPQATAPNRTWYPERFLAPIERNEPWLSLALDKVHIEFDRLIKAGIPPSRTILLGFSNDPRVPGGVQPEHQRRLVHPHVSAAHTQLKSGAHFFSPWSGSPIRGREVACGPTLHLAARSRPVWA